MDWQEVCARPELKDLPFKIELNEDGDIVMSPVRVDHSLFVEKLQELLKGFLPEGHTPPEFPVETPQNTKSPDVVWISKARLQQAKGKVASPIAPEICVEVLSPGNTRKKMEEKRELYFLVGAQEFWLCNEDGSMEFFSPGQKLENSGLIPGFPHLVEI